MSKKPVNDRVPALLRECVAAPNDQAQDMAEDILLRHGYAPQRGELFVYAPGEIPLLLVAHTDTVHRAPPAALYLDSVQEVLWSPNGLGADDRAGVYGVASLLEKGYRPHVLFTDEEETGGAGAREAAQSLCAPPVRLMVQLDRRGATDAVYYSCDNPSLRRWVKRRGFQTAQGSFTDISTLMPAWGIAGVNLSTGYYREHTTSEHLKLAELRATLDKVETMLRRPPRQVFDYVDEFARFEKAPARPIDREETLDEEYNRLIAEHEGRDDWRHWKYFR